ncbi:MAG TPA: YhjD/YihY/BrkB family envelope integrity protein [Chthoniobacterales bacterium]
MVPGEIVIVVAVYLIFDLAMVVLVLAVIFKVLPDAKIRWREVWIGALTSALLFALQWALGLYLGSGAAASAYGAASSLITLLLWIYYSSQILLFGADFTQVHADYFGARIVPDGHAVAVERTEWSDPPASNRRQAFCIRPGFALVKRPVLCDFHRLFPRLWLTQLSKQAGGSIASQKVTRSTWICSKATRARR